MARTPFGTAAFVGHGVRRSFVMMASGVRSSGRLVFVRHGVLAMTFKHPLVLVKKESGKSLPPLAIALTKDLFRIVLGAGFFFLSWVADEDDV